MYSCINSPMPSFSLRETNQAWILSRVLQHVYNIHNNILYTCDVLPQDTCGISQMYSKITMKNVYSHGHIRKFWISLCMYLLLGASHFMYESPTH